MQRRTFNTSIIAAGLTAAALPVAAKDALPRTPSDYEGPYYPVGPREQDTNDLIAGETSRSQVLHFHGRIVDTHGRPLARALLDIWHTDPDGRYKHPRDPKVGKRWPGFRYWGKDLTDEDGRFGFRTFVPGEYPPRPAHIHYKVWHREQNVLTSQVYFRELGGTKGKSRFARESELQIADLIPRDNGHVETDFLVVV